MNLYTPKNVSLINKKQTLAIRSTKQWIMITSTCILVLIGIGICMHYQDMKLWYKQRQSIAFLQNKITHIQPLYDKYHALASKKETITKHQKKIDAYLHHENRPIATLATLMSHANTSLSYNHVAIKKKHLSLGLSARTIADIHSFVQILSQEESIKQIQIASLRYDSEQENYHCSLHAKICKKI